jgi:rod shape determining protein RodA
MYIALVVIGWLMIFAVSYQPTIGFNLFDVNNQAGKQLIFILLCFSMLFVILMTDWMFWRNFGIYIYLLTLLLLPGTLLFGREINGAHAWYQIGSFSLQPAELAKFGTCLAMATMLSVTGINLNQWKTRILAFAIFLTPACIVLIQSDTGSALVFFSFLLVLFREGLSPNLYVTGLGIAALTILGLIFYPPIVCAWLCALVSLIQLRQLESAYQLIWSATFVFCCCLTTWWNPMLEWATTLLSLPPSTPTAKSTYSTIPNMLFLFAVSIPNYFKKNQITQNKTLTRLLALAIACLLVFMANIAFNKILAPHQQLRIKLWLKPAEAEAEAKGSAYNLIHSKMAIGSGGFAGKGFMEGNMTKLRYVPEQSTDFIFCTIGEEQGFIGVTAIIILFTLLLFRITVLAERQRSNFSRVFAYSVAGIFFVHFIINIGMTMGIFPIIGIPLPLISYGGSSLIGFTLLIAVLLKLDSHRNQA